MSGKSKWLGYGTDHTKQLWWRGEELCDALHSGTLLLLRDIPIVDAW